MNNVNQIYIVALEFCKLAQMEEFIQRAKQWEATIKALKSRYYGWLGFDPHVGWKEAGAKALDALDFVTNNYNLNDEVIQLGVMDLNVHFSQNQLKDAGLSDNKINDFENFLKEYQKARLTT